jgi:choline dehydrogenase-like flavoprotein
VEEAGSKEACVDSEEMAMTSEPMLAGVLRATTLEALRRAATHDVIIVGAGASGGLAAMLLAQSGLRVLVLDAGSPSHWWQAPLRRLTGKLVRRVLQPDASRFLPPFVIPRARQAAKALGRWRQPIQSRCHAWEHAPNAFVDDFDCPYVTPPDRPFDWFRSRMLGGRLIVPNHGRQYYRLGPHDFAPPDGLSMHWPLKTGELDPWYALVERQLAVSGTLDNLPWLPDSVITNVLAPTPEEAILCDRIVDRWPGARPILSRYAPPLLALEAAAQTGRLQCRQGAVAREICVDDVGNVSGVSWIDHQTGSEQLSAAPLVFLCASALESTRLLMLSRSRRSPQGLGANSGVLGRYLMDHVIVGVEGFGPPRSDRSVLEQGRCLYLPRFDARAFPVPGAERGYGVQVYQVPIGGGRCYFLASSFAEMLPRPENRVTLDPVRRDAWGIPVLRIDCSYDAAQLALVRDQTQALRELAALAEVEVIRLDEKPRPPGTAVHECGTARMGNDPANSVLDSNNQCWDARGLYVTDASCFPSQGTQNPTLTILALTARACHHAINSTARGSTEIANGNEVSWPV